jgi:glucose dehydrogenase
MSRPGAHAQRRFLRAVSRELLVCSGAASLFLLGCEKHVHISARAEQAGIARASAVALRSGAPADDGQWTMPAKDYENTRFSALTEITPENAKNLRLVWSVKTGANRGHEAAPLVVADAMFVVTPYPNRLLAFDLRRPGSAPKWSCAPETLPAAQGVACCDVVNRGAAYAQGRIYFNTLDGQTVAVGARNPLCIWFWPTDRDPALDTRTKVRLEKSGAGDVK